MIAKLSRVDFAPLVFINTKLDETTEWGVREACSYMVYPYEGEPFKKCMLKTSKNGSLFFPAGLLSEVVQILHDFGYKMDYRSALRIPAHELSFEWNGPKLHDYQEKNINDMEIAAGTFQHFIFNLINEDQNLFFG